MQQMGWIAQTAKPKEHVMKLVWVMGVLTKNGCV